MNSKKQLRHLVSFDEWSNDEIRELIDFAKYVKNHRVYFTGHMQGRTMVMLFQKTSTRTRVSFEAGMTELGGHAIYFDWRTSNFQLSDIDFEAAYLSRNASIIIARMKKNEDLQILKSGSSVPVINGCCNLHHPCQALADMLTILLDRGKLEGATLCYVGVHNNVVNSLIETTTALGIHLVLVTPIAHESSIVTSVVEKAKQKNLISWETDLQKAVNNCEYIYTDTWVDMEFFLDPEFAEEKKKRIEIMMPYQINSELLKNSKAKVMHDMPIHSGYEITREVVASERSIIFQQAENRLDAQKAVVLRLVGTV
ncbi:MAG: ornithine carbamoyltransferase [Leptospiraceae bacterium]|nr:ornithine carbamoyltransferase [Leptospiraceae bacterium]